MTLDKDTLVKQHFWIVEGLALVLLLAAIAIIFGGPAANAKKARDAFEAAKKELSGKSDLKNKDFLPPWERRQAQYAGQKGEVWTAAWETQKDLMFFPVGDRYNFLSQAPFGYNLQDRQKVPEGPELLRSYEEEGYARQFDDRGVPVVVRENDAYLPVAYDPVKIFPRQVWQAGKHPTSEEFWLAQESLWVRRELLKVIRAALDSMGQCKQEAVWSSSMAALGGVAADEAIRREPKMSSHLYKSGPVPEDIQKAGGRSVLFHNHNWEINLLLEPDPDARGRLRVSARSTLKNSNPNRRSLRVGDAHGLIFRVRQGARTANLTKIVGTRLPWGAQMTFTSPTAKPEIDFRKEFGLEEVFTRTTSPIKVVETVALGRPALSHRLSGMVKLVTGKATPPPKEGEPAGGQPAPTEGGAVPMGGGAIVPPVGPGGQPVIKNGTPNGLDRERYVLTNDQVRRIPIAFSIVVDQAYRNEVLAAVVESRLRIQTTQVYWIHRDNPAGSAAPAEGFPEAPPMMDGEVGMPPGEPGGPGFPVVGPPGRPAFPGGPRVGIPIGNDSEKKDASSDVNRNLISLSVHGIATLYDRPAPTAKTEGKGTNQPMQP
jgi:hypothetical protein